MQDICTDTGLLKEVGAPGELSVGASEEQFLSRETPQHLHWVVHLLARSWRAEWYLWPLPGTAIPPL